MKGVKLNVTREQWKRVLVDVIASQGEGFLPKGEIMSRTAVKVGYAEFSAPPPMAFAALIELQREGRVEEFHPEGRGPIKGYRLTENGKPGAEDAIVSLFARAPNTSSVSHAFPDLPADEAETADDYNSVSVPEEAREDSAPESFGAADLARLCTELFAFFEKTGEGLIDMARMGKALIGDLGRAKAESASPLSRHREEPNAALEGKVDRLTGQIAALSELFGVQKREFENRQAGLLSMLEEEARRRGNGTHRQEGRRGDSDKDPAGIPWRSG